ncbi:MAG: LptF/LptG family permease, partial [Planctomycetes bacterium]|nr:LptF/LptG family permease [Planctomycetota bacterium]
MPWTLLRSLLRETLISFLLALVGLTAVFVVILLMQALSRFEMISTSTLLSMIPSMASGYQTLLLPIAALTAVSLAYARLATTGEKTALFASGVSPVKVLFPALLIGVVIVPVGAWAAFKLAPDSYRQRDRLRTEALADALHNPPAGAQDFDFTGFSLSYSDFRNGVFYDLVLRREYPEGKDVILAKQVRIDYDELADRITLHDGRPTTFLHFNAEGALDRVAAEQVIEEATQTLGTRKQAEAGIKGIPLGTLMERMRAEAGPDFKDRRHHLYVFSRRLSETLSPLFFALIGALAAFVVPAKNRLIPLFAGLLLAAGTYFGGLS